MLDNLQTLICQTVSPTLAISLEPLAHHRHVNSLLFSTGITLVYVKNLKKLN